MSGPGKKATLGEPMPKQTGVFGGDFGSDFGSDFARVSDQFVVGSAVGGSLGPSVAAIRISASGTLSSVPIADNHGQELHWLEILVTVTSTRGRAEEFVGDLYDKLADFRRLVPEERTARRLTILWALGVLLRKLPSIWRLFHGR